MRLTLRIPSQPALREYIRPRSRPARKRLRDNFLRVTQTVDCRGVDPVDAQLERAVDCSDGIIVVLISPCELPSRAANRPGSKSHGSDVQIRISKLFGFHVTRCFL